MKAPKKNKFVFNPARIQQDEFAPPVSLEIARACAEIMLNKRIAKPTKKQWVRFTNEK